MTEVLLQRLTALGIAVRIDGDSLKVADPRGALTDELRAAIRENKQAFLDHIRIHEMELNLQAWTDDTRAVLDSEDWQMWTSACRTSWRESKQWILELDGIPDDRAAKAMEWLDERVPGLPTREPP